MSNIKISQQEYMFFLSQLAQISPYGYYFKYTFNSCLDLYRYKEDAFFEGSEKIGGKDLDFQLQAEVAFYNLTAKHLVTCFWTDNMDREHFNTPLKKATKEEKRIWKDILEGKIKLSDEQRGCSGKIINYFNIVHLMYDYFMWIIDYFRKDKGRLERFITFIKNDAKIEDVSIHPIPCTKIIGLFCGIGEYANINKINYLSALIEKQVNKYIRQNNTINKDGKEYGWVHTYLDENCCLELRYIENGGTYKEVIFGTNNPTDKQIKTFYYLFFDIIEEGISYYFKNIFTRQFSEDYDEYLLDYETKRYWAKVNNRDERKKEF